MYLALRLYGIPFTDHFDMGLEYYFISFHEFDGPRIMFVYVSKRYFVVIGSEMRTEI